MCTLSWNRRNRTGLSFEPFRPGAHGRNPCFTHIGELLVSWCENVIGAGMNSGVFAGIAEHHALVSGTYKIERVGAAGAGFKRLVHSECDIRPCSSIDVITQQLEPSKPYSGLSYPIERITLREISGILT